MSDQSASKQSGFGYKKWVAIITAVSSIIAIVPPIISAMRSNPSVNVSGTGNTTNVGSTVNSNNSIINNYFTAWVDGVQRLTGLNGKPEAISSSTPTLVGQPTPTTETARPTGTSYVDGLIRATPEGASFDKYQFAQTGLAIENISGKELLLAVEYRGVRAISNLGGSSECSLDGLKAINGLPREPDPLQFSRLAPSAKLSVGITNCQGITPKDKARSLSINIPLLTIENEKTRQFSAALNGIPISQ